MKIWKRTLYVLIPIAIILVIWIIFTAITLIRQDKEVVLDDSNTITNTHYVSTETNNVFGETIHSLKNTASDLLNGWQDSSNIKQGEYRAPEEPLNIQEQPAVMVDADTSVDVQVKKEQDFSIWDWIPTTKNQTVIATQESPEIVAIREYGNTYGAELKHLSNTAGDQAQIMEGVLTSRINDAQSTRAIITLAEQYKATGVALAQIPAPKGFERNGLALANSYTKVGDLTAQLTEGATDAEKLELIYKYNAGVDEFATNFLAFANLFGAYGVTFKNGDGGDILMPPM